MSNRYLDWFRQAEADLRHARRSLEHEMRFGRQGRFLNSVVIKSTDREQIQVAVIAFAEYLRKQHPEIERVI